MRIEFRCEAGLKLGERDVRWRDPKISLRRLGDDLLERAVAIRKRIVDATSKVSAVDIRESAVSLRVEIDQQRRFSTKRESRRKIDRCRGLPHATFLVGNGDDHQQQNLRTAAVEERETEWRLF